MTDKRPTYEIKSPPLSRRLVMDSVRIGKRKHTIMALIEADVTSARAILHDYREKTGERISFTAFIICCLGKAIDQNRYLHACRDLRGRLILFEEVDCTTLIEIDLQGEKFPLAHIIRAINKRSVQSIHEEIRSIQNRPDTSQGFQSKRQFLNAFLLLPAFVRDIFYFILARSPRLFKQQIGTIMVSAVGMFGHSSGWGISPVAFYTTNLILGGIAEKPGVVEDQIAVREYLSLTINFDHDIIDGAPAARFAARFIELIEGAYGLDDYQ